VLRWFQRLPVYSHPNEGRVQKWNRPRHLRRSQQNNQRSPPLDFQDAQRCAKGRPPSPKGRFAAGF
jgi:hypothetical protein